MTPVTSSFQFAEVKCVQCRGDKCNGSDAPSRRAVQSDDSFVQSQV